MLYFTATPVGITIQGIQGTMDLLLEIIHTENTPIPVPEMTMAQCREDMGMTVCCCKVRSDLTWSSANNGPSCFSDRDGYGGGREPRSYMDRPSGGSYRDSYDGYGKTDFIGVVAARAAKITKQITALTTPISSHEALQFFHKPRGNGISGSTIEPFVLITISLP